MNNYNDPMKTQNRLRMNKSETNELISLFTHDLLFINPAPCNASEWSYSLVPRQQPSS